MSRADEIVNLARRRGSEALEDYFRAARTRWLLDDQIDLELIDLVEAAVREAEERADANDERELRAFVTAALERQKVNRGK